MRAPSSAPNLSAQHDELAPAKKQAGQNCHSHRALKFVHKLSSKSRKKSRTIQDKSRADFKGESCRKNTSASHVAKRMTMALSGVQNGSKMGPKWVQNGSKMGPKWVQNGVEMGPKWGQNGAKMGPKWGQNGSEMGPKWVQNGA